VSRELLTVIAIGECNGVTIGIPAIHGHRRPYMALRGDFGVVDTITLMWLNFSLFSGCRRPLIRVEYGWDIGKYYSSLLSLGNEGLSGQ
jgi:hypothetical protein